MTKFLLKIFFSLDINICNFIDKTILKVKVHFCNISATITSITGGSEYGKIGTFFGIKFLIYVI